MQRKKEEEEEEEESLCIVMRDDEGRATIRSLKTFVQLDQSVWRG
jgi:hypothetical protein